MIIECITCGKEVDVGTLTQEQIDDGEELPNQCPECPPVDDDGKLY